MDVRRDGAAPFPSSQVLIDRCDAASGEAAVRRPAVSGIGFVGQDIGPSAWGTLLATVGENGSASVVPFGP